MALRSLSGMYWASPCSVGSILTRILTPSGEKCGWFCIVRVKVWFLSDSAGISVWVLQMASLNLQRTVQMHRFSVLCRNGASGLVLVCVAVTAQHRNVLLHTCFFLTSVKVWEWPGQFPSTAGDLLSLQGCEQLVDCQRSWNVSMQNI